MKIWLINYSNAYLIFIFIRSKLQYLMKNKPIIIVRICFIILHFYHIIILFLYQWLSRSRVINIIVSKSRCLFDLLIHRLLYLSKKPLFVEKTSVCRKDPLFVEKTWGFCRKDPNCQKGHKDNIKTNLVKYLKY